ncbi:YchO/YchP family invasin [Erwinia psidii]|uniref:YchO/YchP family invasin n=1 Tax=Erwinia psidii TaxID=69224 RepID=A0A3N6RZF3_9GAMM|nr:YchO/YchP family invasin [Erwinia psidii]MCX8961253.1 YchO/YchP family invasin [Erwinia psidii]MCX8966430.1 YchO/YchP family invasin [Erwinia psidii]RQM38598.1 YchO/YchP family invasin [Erwinia psidii]
MRRVNRTVSLHRRLILLVAAFSCLQVADATTPGTQLADTPFDDPARFSRSLPDLGSAASSDAAFEKRVAQAMKSIGEASMNSDDDKSLGSSAGQWAFDHFRDEATSRAESEGRQLLSPYGRASLSLDVDSRGNFDGTSAQLVTPWRDNYAGLTFSQIGIQQSSNGLSASAGLGQRWLTGGWRLGYNAFIDDLVASGQQRGSLGAEASGDFLRFSANYYQPLSGWRDNTEITQMRMAQGYDITTEGFLPFYRQLGVSLSYEQYFGDNVGLFNSGTYGNNPAAVELGINYTPMPLFTLTASRKTADTGETQDQLGLKMNYQIGVALSKQLSASNVAASRSLSGSRYDPVKRNNTPVMDFRQRKTLSVFLATPPWQLHPGEALPLKLQIRHANPIKAISWQGDTQALSLTSAANSSDPQGWSIIIPQWDNSPDAANAYHLSVTLEDSRQQRVTSNWITIKLAQPVAMDNRDDNQFDVMAP